MNKDQASIVYSKERKILIEAGPGTGKTYTLIKAIEQYNKDNIAVITFTNAAAEELKLRLKNDKYYIGTIHKFCSSLIEEMSSIFHFIPRLLTAKEIEGIIYRILRENDDKFSLQQVRDLMFFLTTPDEYIDTHGEIADFMYDIKKEYEAYKETVGIYDYTDSPKYLLELMKYYDYYPYIEGLFVDEGQDISEIEYEIFNCLLSPKKVIIGDPHQSIYLFRDAKPEIFQSFIDKGFKLYRLTYNYRSFQEIIDNAGIDQISTRGSGGIVDRLHPEILLQCSPQILCRTNLEVNRIKRYYPNVCTIHKAKGLEWDNVILIDFKQKSNEDKNIRFVALTRARDIIGIYDIDIVERTLRHGIH